MSVFLRHLLYICHALWFVGAVHICLRCTARGTESWQDGDRMFGFQSAVWPAVRCWPRRWKIETPAAVWREFLLGVFHGQKYFSVSVCVLFWWEVTIKSILVAEMTKSLCGHYWDLGGTSEEMGLQSSDPSEKQVSDGADVTFCGRGFHSWEAATGKAQLPVVERRVRRTTYDDDEAEQVSMSVNVV